MENEIVINGVTYVKKESSCICKKCKCYPDKEKCPVMAPCYMDPFRDNVDPNCKEHGLGTVNFSEILEKYPELKKTWNDKNELAKKSK